MPLVIPNAVAGATNEQLKQAAPDNVDFLILGYADEGVGVISGAAVTVSGGANVAAGVVAANNAAYSFPAVALGQPAANVSGNPRLDLIIYRVGTGVIYLQGTAAAWPYTVMPTPTFPTDVVLACVYVANGFSAIASGDVIDKRAAVQPAPMGATPTLGAKIVGMGHSFMQGYGAIPATHGFMSQIAGMLRGRLWNQAVDGASLAGTFVAGVNGYGGIPQILQQYLPPKQPINWLGAYSATPYYNQDDGVTVATGLTCSTSGSSTTLTTTGSYTTSNIVAGMVISGTGITPGTYVVQILTATTLQMSAPMTVSSETVTFTGWYRAATTTHAVTPAGVGNATNWNLVAAGNVGYFGSPWNSQSVLPLMMFGNNDIVHAAQRNPQPFLSAFEAMCARIASAMVWEDNNPMVTLGGGTWTSFTMAALGAANGSGTTVVTVPNTAAASISFQTPPDWPGGYVDMGFLLGVNAAAGAAGTLDFTVDGSAVNCLCSGSSPTNAINFGTPLRQTIVSCALGHTTGAATDGLAASTASGVTLNLKTPLPFAVGSGSTIIVGGVNGGPSQTFTTTAGSSANTSTLTVGTQTPTVDFPIGTPVYDATTTDSGWMIGNDIVVRVPVPAGSHLVAATVPGSPSIANLYFDYVSFEAEVQPIGLVFGLWKMPNLLGMGGSCVTYQDIDIWNADLAAVLGPGNEWPHVFVDINNVFMDSEPLTTALTLGQTGVTSLACTGQIPFSVATGDVIQLGSGATVQYVTASAPAAIGATAISVTSFTSSYAQPLGTPVSNFTQASKLFYQDGVHPNVTGHSLLAAVVWQNLLNSLQQPPQLIAVQSQEAGRPTTVMNLASGTDLPVGSTGSAGAWSIVVGPELPVVAEPGDVLEISIAGLYDALAATGSLDIVTFNAPAYVAGNTGALAAVINYLSGAAALGGNTTNVGLGYAAVGAQATNGLSALYSPGASTTVPEPIVGTFYYPVQPADIIDGQVYIGLVGRSSTTSVRHIKNASGYQLSMSVVNQGPVSFNAEA